MARTLRRALSSLAAPVTSAWAAAAVLFAMPAPAFADWVYSYTGSPLVYSGVPSPTYGTHAIAKLTVTDATFGSHFTGTLSTAQFSVWLGTDTMTPSPAGDWSPWGTYPPVPVTAYVSFADGMPVDWNFGTVQVVAYNNVLITSTRTGESIRPYPRVVYFGTADSAGAGRWSLSTSPVPAPASNVLMAGGLVVIWLVVRRTRMNR